LKNEAMFRTGSVWRAIFTMAVPSVVIIFVMFLYNIADMFFVGCLGDTAQVAAVSVVGPVFSILAAAATMLGAGGCTIIARCFGAGEVEKGRVYSSLCCWAGTLLGVLVCAILLLCGTPLLRMLGSTPETTAYARQYLQVLAVGAPFLVLANTAAMLLRAEGAVKDGLIGNLLGTVTNLLLDPLFILAFRWGVTGAAASVLGNVVATGFYMRYITRKGTVLTVDPRFALQKPAALGEILVIGLPNGIGSLLSGFASTFSNRLLSAYGTGAIAAMAAAGKTTMLIGMITMAICMGCQPLLAYSYGAGDKRRLRELLKNIGLLTMGIGLAAGVACLLGRKALIGMFIKEAAVTALGEKLVVWLVLGSPVIGLTYLATNLLQSVNKAMSAVVLSLLRQGLLLLPLLYGLNFFFGVAGIAAAHFAADTGAALIAAVMLARIWKKELT
jgi:multidrug efflux pump